MGLTNVGGGGAMVLLGDLTLTEAGTLEIQNLPTGYKNLYIHANLLSPSGNNSVYMIFNNDTGANYYHEILYAVAAVVASACASGDPYIPAGYATAGSACSCIASHVNNASGQVHGYVNDFGFQSGATGRVYLTGGHYNSTTEITRVKIYAANDGTFGIGSRLTIFGVK